MDIDSSGVSMIPFLKVVHSRSGIDTDISEYVSTITINQGSEATKNTTNVTLLNKNGVLNSLAIEQDDDITVYLDVNPITTQDPLITAVVQALDFTTSEKKNQIKLKCSDKTYLFLSKLWSKAYTTTGALTADQVVINVVENISDTGDPSTQLGTSFVSTTKSDGTSFTKVVEMSKVWKPAYEWLNDLSNTEYTGEDRDYVYYVDKNNQVHWFYPFQKVDIYLASAIDASQTTITVDSTSTYPSTGVIQIEDEQITYTGKTSTTFTGCSRGQNETTAVSHVVNTLVSAQVLEEGKNGIYNIKLTKSNEGAYNFIIFNAGRIPADYELLWYAYDDKRSEKEFRMTKKDWKDLSLNIYQDEITTNPTDWTTSNTQLNPDSGSYPYTTSWGEVVADDAAFNTAFVAQIKTLGIARAQAQFDKLAGGTFKGTINTTGNINYSVNDIVTVINPSNNINQKMRIKSLRYQLTTGGFSVEVGLSEDLDAKQE